MATNRLPSLNYKRRWPTKEQSLCQASLESAPTAIESFRP